MCQVYLKLATTKDNTHSLIRFEPSTNVSLNPKRENVCQGTIYDYNMDSIWSPVVNIFNNESCPVKPVDLLSSFCVYY